MAGAGSGAALAQEADAASEVLPLRAAVERREVTVLPVLDVDGACGHADMRLANAGDAVGCPFDDTTIGLTLASQFEAEGNSFRVRTAFARESDAGLVLDRQFGDYLPGTSGEVTIATLALDSSLLDERLSLESEIGWSRSWRTPIANSPLQPLRTAEHAGWAQSHRIEARLLDGKGAKWTVDASYRTSAGNYRPVALAAPLQLFAIGGDELAIGSKARLGGWSIAGSWRQHSNAYFDSHRWKGSLGRSGWSLSYARSATASHGITLQGLSSNQARLERDKVGLDVMPLALFPQLAAEDGVLASLAPLSLSLEFGRHRRERYSEPGVRYFDGHSFSAVGVWSTMLGDTLLTYEREEQWEQPTSPGARLQVDETILVDHSIQLGDWSLGGNVMLTGGNSSGNPQERDGNRMTFFGASAKYRTDGGPELSIGVGRDAMDFEIDGGSLKFSDRTTRIDAMLDLSSLLNRKLDRDDMHLRLDARLDLGGESYEFRFLDEVIDSDFERLSSQGVLLTFGMKLNQGAGAYFNSSS